MLKLVSLNTIDKHFQVIYYNRSDPTEGMVTVVPDVNTFHLFFRTINTGLRKVINIADYKNI